MKNNPIKADPPTTKKKITAFSLILLTALFLITEILARIVIANPKTFEMFSNDGEYNASAIWRHQWIKRKRKQIKIDPESFMFSYAQHHPVRGWQLRKNSNNPNEFRSKSVRVNSKGIRGQREYPYQRVKGKRRILILGDSFTFGTEVSDNETYPHYLQELLPDDEIINMGVFGYGHDQMLLYLKEEGIKYKPDIVMIGYLSCDECRNLLSFRDYEKPFFKIKNNKLILKNTPIPSPDQLLKNEIWHLKIMDLLSILKHKVSIKSGKYFFNEKETTNIILEEMVKTIEEMEAIPIILHLDGIRDNQDTQKSLIPKIKEFLTYWRKEKQVHTFFLLHHVDKAKRDLYKKEIETKDTLYIKRKYRHFSPFENKVIAASILQELKNL